MIPNILELKEKSSKFQRYLRFSIDSLEINDNGRWKNLRDLEGLFTSKRGRSATLKLRDILLDTGNQAKFCLIPGNFFRGFTNSFINSETVGLFESKLLKSVDGTSVDNSVSLNSFEFRLFKNVIFESKIGFRWKIDPENMNTINIGINCLKQFLSIIFNISPDCYYYCLNL